MNNVLAATASRDRSRHERVQGIPLRKPAVDDWQAQKRQAGRPRRGVLAFEIELGDFGVREQADHDVNTETCKPAHLVIDPVAASRLGHRAQRAGSAPSTV